MMLVQFQVQSKYGMSANCTWPEWTSKLAMQQLDEKPLVDI